MASTLASGLTAATQQAQFDSIIQEFVSVLCREGFADGYISRHAGSARHFLTWLVRRDFPLRTVDGTVLDCFLQHDCDCCSGVPAAVLLHPWRKRRSSPEVMQFVRFLERTGRIDQPGDLDDNQRILDAFLERLRGDGFARETMRALPERRRGSDCLAPSVADPPAGPEPGGARTVPAETVTTSPGGGLRSKVRCESNHCSAVAFTKAPVSGRNLFHSGVGLSYRCIATSHRRKYHSLQMKRCAEV